LQEVDLVVDDAGTFGGPFLWRCKYRAASAGTYKWHVIGQQAMWKNDVTSITKTASGPGDPLTGTIGPSITIPNAGIYDFMAQAEVQLGAVAGAWGGVNIAINNTVYNTTTTDEERGLYFSPAAAVSYATPTAHRRLTVATAGFVAKVVYYANGTNNIAFASRRLMATPVRIG
jgi:hypothetical protein